MAAAMAADKEATMATTEAAARMATAVATATAVVMAGWGASSVGVRVRANNRVCAQKHDGRW